MDLNINKEDIGKMNKDSLDKLVADIGDAKAKLDNIAEMVIGFAVAKALKDYDITKLDSIGFDPKNESSEGFEGTFMVFINREDPSIVMYPQSLINKKTSEEMDLQELQEYMYDKVKEYEPILKTSIFLKASEIIEYQKIENYGELDNRISKSTSSRPNKKL